MPESVRQVLCGWFAVQPSEAAGVHCVFPFPLPQLLGEDPGRFEDADGEAATPQQQNGGL